MKKNELKKLAMNIAVLQKKLDKTEDKKERRQLENDIMRLSNQIENLEDLFAIDELILKFLN